jgi:enterochelin esterase-like enzyme
MRVQAIAMPTDWSLLSGPLPAAVTLLGLASAVFLLARQGRAWWLYRVAPVIVGAILVTAAAVGFVDRVWRPFPDALPLPVVGWITVAVAAAGLGAVRGLPVRARWRRPAGAALAAVLVVLTAAVQVNIYFGQYPAVRNAIGLAPRNVVHLADVTARRPVVVDRPGDGALLKGWKPPADMPAAGRLAQIHIPGTRSGFRARDGWVWLPPAYLASSHPRLPVLILLAGQPGRPGDWFDGGRLDTVLNAFAARHRGLAPVVVIPDDLGGPLANPLCMDSRLGRAETYLTVDVPAWIRQNLQVDPDTDRWAVGGYSHGGTCALQLAVRRPDLFPTFVDVSGQREPTLGGGVRRTVDVAFGGDAAAFHAVNPLDTLATRRFPHTLGVLAVGRDDRDYGPQQRDVRRACRQAGMRVEWVTVPGGHNWTAWKAGFTRGLDLIGSRLGFGAS